MKINKTLKISRKNFTWLVYALVILIVAPLILITTNNKTKVAKAAWYSDSAWQYRQKVTIDHTKIPNTSQTDFPVLIKITNQYNQVFASAKDNGTDILFTDSNGAKLSHEIDLFSKSSKELYAWIKVPVLSSATDTTLYMYYGNSDASDQQNKTDVWSHGYAAVWHLNESSGSSLDSSSSNISGTLSAGVTQNNTGKVGKDYLLNGSGAVNYGNSSALPNGTSARTMCTWAKTNSIAAGYAWNFAYGTGNTSQAMFIGRLGTALYGGGYANDVSVSNYWTVGDWKYTCLTYNGTNATLYGNGAQLAAPTAKSWNLVRNSTVLGSQVPSGEYWNGDVDEVRISSVARSADWIATEYNNQVDPAGFATLSYEMNQSNYATVPEKEWASGNWLYRQKIQILNNTAGALIDYQALIDSSSVDLVNLFDRAKSDGADIRFSTNGSTEEIPYYIQTYSQGSSSAKIWVKVPYIPPSSSAYIYLYYGNSSASSASSLANVSDSTETKITTGLTASATSSGFPASNAINGNYSDYWHGANDGQLHSFWVTGVSNKILSTIKVYHYSGQWASTFKIQGSNDSFASDVREFANVTSPTQNMTFSNINDSASAVKYNTLSSAAWYNPTLYEFELYTKFKIATTEPTVSLSGSQLYFDMDPPVNPSAFTAKNIQGGGITLNASNYYNYTTPYFSWPAVNAVGGASDTITNVDGYYLYFGTSCGVSGANPATARGVLPDLGSGLNYSANTTLSIPDLGSSNGTYCLRIRTKDSAGNLADAFEAFSYKYEVSVPNKPSYIAVNPAGYSSVDSFTFSWPVATDADSTPQSGLAGYQYKTGADAAQWSETQVGASVSSVQSYQSGSNVFLVRSVDTAGNYSPTVQSTYYYSSNPPSKPISLTATPSISSSNSFSFDWSAPIHDVTIINYGYSVNAYPTVENIIWTNSTNLSLAEDSYATKQGANTIYLVAKDETGAYSLGEASVASTEFNCTTSSPPIPLQVSISDSSNRAADLWALTVKWSAGTNQGASFDYYTIYRSINNEDFAEVATTRSTAYIDSSSLVNTTKYYYKIKAVDNAGAKSAFSEVVFKTPTGRYDVAPTITAQPEVSVKASNATFTWETDRSSSSFVRYGTDIGNLSESKGQYDLVTNHSVYISGLQANTKYYYQVQSVDEFRDYSLESAYSIMYSFTTLAAPGFLNVISSDLSLFSATVNFETTSPSQVSLRYGTSINYGQALEDESSSLTSKHTIKVNDLSSGTTYHFKLSGVDIDGNALISDDYIFTTLPMPVVSNLGYQPDYAGPTPGIKIIWKTNVPTSSSVEYVPKLGSIFEEASKSALTYDHEIILLNLKDNTTYSFNVYGADQFGNVARSDSNVLSTPNDSRPPAITDVSIESQNNNDTSQSSAQIAIAFKTDEISSVQIEYGEGVGGDNYTSKTQEDTSQTINHLVIISNLDASKTYHLRIVARDAAQNVSYSDDNVVITKKAQASPFNTILKALTRAFSWINWFK